MPSYSIRDLEALSGVKAHTIRIWEQRYRLLNPDRGSGNVRSYSERDLRKLLNISILYNKGEKISRIATLDEQDLTHRVIQASKGTFHPENIIKRMIDRMIALDQDGFEEEMDRCIMDRGYEETITQVIYPFFERIGILWITGSINPSQEHFISNLVRQKMVVAIENLEPAVSNKGKTFLLFLPEMEWHELGLLFYQYLIKKQGYNIIYLGQCTSLDEILQVEETREIDFIFTMITANLTSRQLKDYLEDLSSRAVKQTIFITGHQTANINWPLPSNILQIQSAEQFVKRLTKTVN
jgi:DNA-binding transcriptional MerR regulator